jgi:hypothetical protein
MADVIQKCISANNIHEATTLCYVSKGGHKQVLRADKEKTISIQRIEDKLTTKFDDVSYYSS